MQRYKNGQFISTSKEEAEKIQKSFGKYKNKRRSDNELEARVKVLEDAVAALVAKQDHKEEV